MSEPNTQQQLEMNDLRQLVVFIRHKAPAPAGLGGELAAAEGMVSKVTGAVEAATSAVESAMAAIPGLNMFIKEDKKNIEAQDKYDYFEKYDHWDKIASNTEDTLTDMNPESLIHTFEYEPKDASGRKEDGQALAGEIKSKIADWKKYTANIHFVGLADGGNIANECANSLADDNNFSKEKWTIKSIIYVGTTLYQDTHKLNKNKLKGIKTISYGNPYDFTQNAIAYFEPTSQLIQQIKDANKGTLSLFVGKIKMHMVQALAVLLKGVHLGNSGSGQSPTQLYNGIKDEIEGLIKEVVGSAKQLIGEGVGLIKPGDIPQFQNLLNGYDQLPSKVVAELKQFFDDFKNILSERAEKIKTGETNLGLSDLSKLLNCLCPLFDTLTASLQIFKYGEPAAESLSQQIIEGCGIEKIHAPSKDKTQWLSVDKKLIADAAEAAINNQPDQTTVILSKLQDLLKEASARTTTIKDMNPTEKAKLAEAIYLIMSPMLPTKLTFYKKLINAIPFNLGELLDSISANEYLSKITGPLNKIGIETPERLQNSVTAFDKEFQRIVGYINKNNYPSHEKYNSLYFIYNSHNIMLSTCWGDIAHSIDEQTGIVSYKAGQGYVNSYNTDENTYTRQGDEEITNTVPAKKVTEETANTA